jgi:hypothetical protein
MHGIIVIGAIAAGQLIINYWRSDFLNYNPPIGLAFFMASNYLILPLLIGALNVVLLTWLFHLQGCQTGAWLSGLFLILTFTAINIALQTVMGLTLSVPLAIIEVLLLAFPFSFIGRLTKVSYRKEEANQKNSSSD